MPLNFVEYAGPPSLALGAAAVCAAIGFRKVTGRRAKHFRIAAALLVLAVPVWLLVVPAPDGWTRHLSADGACSAEFPQQPQHEANPDGDDRLEVARPDRNAHYSLTFSDMPPETAALPPDEQFDKIRSSFASKNAPDGTAPKLVKELAVADRGVPGREYQFAVGDRLATRIKVFVAGRRIYRAIAVNPPDPALDRDAQRFIDSVRFERGP